MSNILSLLCAISLGLFLGTQPGVREKMPWGNASSETADVESLAPRPVAPAAYAPASSSGGWMQEKGRTSLEQGATGNRSCSGSPAGSGTTMLSR